MDKYIIGEMAGTVWKLLEKNNRKWEFDELKKATGYEDAQLGAAIGWLARENKIEFELGKGDNSDKAFMYLMPNVYIG